MPQLQFGPNLTTAGINVDFPITALNQRDVIGSGRTPLSGEVKKD